MVQHAFPFRMLVSFLMKPFWRNAEKLHWVIRPIVKVAPGGIRSHVEMKSAQITLSSAIRLKHSAGYEGYGPQIGK